jgi:AmmeMemoRadiSam system protein B
MNHATWQTEARPPAVAGTFYPADPSKVTRMIDQWCAGAASEQGPWRAALIPHAGWIFSGRIAAEVLQRIHMPSTIVILCPKHRAGGAECAIAPWQRWAYPGGTLETNVPLAEQLAREVPGLQFDERPHRLEHAIEVQLPLLSRFAPDSQIVGISIGRIELPQCQNMAASLAHLLRDQPGDILLVISSDMNHFADDVENRRLDELALEALDQLDPERLYHTCRREQISMCGMLPAVIVLTALQRLDRLHRAVRVNYTTSAEASGDRSRVVGYAGMLFD